MEILLKSENKHKYYLVFSEKKIKQNVISSGKYFLDKADKT